MPLNKVMLIGNVGRDPDVRYMDGSSSNGQERKVATFSLATSERYRSRTGEQIENTEWHNIVVWSPIADVVERYVKKGTQLYVEGRLRTRQWTDQSGAKRYTTEIVADNLQLLGRRDDAPAADYSAGGQSSYRSVRADSVGAGYKSPSAPTFQPPVAPATPAAPATPIVDDPDDDLPF